MKKGQIIRRITSTGRITGPYMQIERIVDGCVYAKVLGLREPAVMLLKQNVHILTTKGVYVSEEKLHEIKRGLKQIISHPACKLWENLYKEKPQILHLYCRPKMYDLYVVTSAFYKKRELTLRGDPYIFITIDRVLS